MAKYRVPVLDSFSWQEPVISKTIRDVQISPIRGHRYIVPDNIVSVENPWINQKDKIAWYDGCVWKFDTPINGWYVYVQDESKLYKYDGENWRSEESSSVVTIELNVDGNRTDDYVETGSIIKPYKTIQSAINHIINLEDNSVQKGYVIKVSPGLYNEDLDFSSEYLINIEIRGSGYQNTYFESLSEIQTINSDILLKIVIDGFTFNKDITFEGISDNTPFGKYGFKIKNSYFDESYLILRNINNPELSNVGSNSTILWSNINNGHVSGTQLIDTFIIEINQLNKPELWDSEINIGTNINITEQRIKDIRFNSIYGNVYGNLYINLNGCIVSSQVQTIPMNVVINAYNTLLIGDWTLSNSSRLILNGGSFVTGELIESEYSILDISGQKASQLVLGQSQNMNLNDGLLDIDENSRVSVVIDKINEVLKYITPPEPDSLNDIELECSCLKYTGKLSAGLPTNWYLNGYSPGMILNNIIISNQFNIFTGIGDPNLFDQNKLPLNTNSSRFRKGNKGLLKVVYNDVNVAILDISANFIIVPLSNDLYLVQDLSLWNHSGRGTSCVEATVNFSNNKGSLQITDVRQFNIFLFYKMNAKLNIINLDSGFNSIQLIHDDIDPIEISKKFNVLYDNNSLNLIFSQVPIIQEFELSSSKYISGIRYYSIGDKFSISFIGINVFRNCYCIDKVVEYRIDGISDIRTKIQTIVPNFNDQLVIDEVVNIDEENFYETNSRLHVTLFHPWKTSRSAISTSDNRLICTYDIKSTATEEYFVDEYWRLPIGQYNSIPNNLNNNWDSIRELSNGDALVYNQCVMFPDINLTNSFPINNPDYTGFNGPQMYLRSFYSPNPNSNVELTLTGISKSDVDSIGHGNVNIDVKLPGLTGWLDISRFFNISDFNGIDGDACLVSQFESSWNITFGHFSTIYSGGIIIIRIRFNNTNCSITRMSINW